MLIDSSRVNYNLYAYCKRTVKIIPLFIFILRLFFLPDQSMNEFSIAL